MDPQMKVRLENALQRIRDEMKEKQKKQPYFPVAGIGLLILFSAAKFGAEPKLIGNLLLALGAVLGWLYYKPYFEAKGKFKGFILPKVAEALRPGLKYRPEGTMSKERFKRADLYSGGYDHYKEEDEFQGKTRNVQFGLREVRLTANRGSGKNRRQVSVFQGVVFNIEFPKSFNGHTHVGPDHVEKAVGGYLGGMLQDIGKSFSERKRVQLEHPDFERLFVVSSTDQHEARYLITPKMMELLMQFRDEFGKDVVFSFLENQIYIAFSHLPIEFPFERPMAIQESIDKMAHLIDMVDRVIEALELDNQIWKKTS